MEIKPRHQGDILILDVTGRLDKSTAGQAHDAADGFAKSGAKRVLLNLDKVEYMSSAGLRAVLTLARLLQTMNGELKICNAHGGVKDVLQASGFNSLIRIFTDEKSAVDSWR